MRLQPSLSLGCQLRPLLLPYSDGLNSQYVAAAAMKSFVHTMLSNFLVVGPLTEASGTGDTPGDEALLAGSGDAQV